MTKTEKSKCEKLCIEAISSVKESNRLYEEARKIDSEFHDATVELRKADHEHGYAMGINQVLVLIGYDSELLEELSNLVFKGGF